MTLLFRERGTVVDSALTWKGHAFEHYADGRFLVRDRDNEEIVAMLADAQVESRDGSVYRIVGIDAAGDIRIWRATKTCARCSTAAVYPTPSYDVPS